MAKRMIQGPAWPVYFCDAEGNVIPAVDSTSNLTMVDVIGSKVDTSAGDSVYGRLFNLWQYFNYERKVYPTLAAGATVISANSVWGLGNYATIVPAGAIAARFHVHNISIETCSDDGVFQLELYQGASDILVTSIRFAQSGGFFGPSVFFVGSAFIPAGAQIRARLASSDGLANQCTITMSIGYITHT